MLRSLSTAVSGLRSHQSKLDVIGNNIANVNTVGYKSSAARFQDIFSQTVKGATAPFGGRGGMNPAQIGLGVEISTIDTLHGQGPITGTGQETDLAIEGSGFFIVSDGSNYFYTRDGSFVRDASGEIVNSSGFKLLGWVGETTDTSRSLEPIHIPLGEELITIGTENILFSGNLSAADLTNIHYNVTFLEGLEFSAIPRGSYEINTQDAVTGADARVIGSTSLASFDLVDNSSADVMHYVEVLDKLPGDDGFIRLRVLELNKMDGALEEHFLTADFDAVNNNYRIGDIGAISYGNSTIAANVAAGDKFLLDFSSDLSEEFALTATSGGSQGQEIKFRQASFHDGENGPFYTMFMHNTSGEISMGRITFTKNSETFTTASPAAHFSVEPHEYDTYVFDSLGNRHALSVNFTSIPGENKWAYTISHSDGFIEVENNRGIIAFTEDGRFDAFASTIGQFSFDPGTGAKRVTITPDFSEITQLAYPSNVYARLQDGFEPGELTSFNVESSGIITGTYSNGMVRQIAQLALANFSNPTGLLKTGANLYSVSSNSGQPLIGFPGMEGRGFIRSRSLEMSNVDLAAEFTEMITTSRGFQANTRVITTSDEVLLELINIKR